MRWAGSATGARSRGWPAGSACDEGSVEAAPQVKRKVKIKYDDGKQAFTGKVKTAFVDGNNLNPATTATQAYDDNGNGTTAPSFSGGAAPCTLPTTSPSLGERNCEQHSRRHGLSCDQVGYSVESPSSSSCRSPSGSRWSSPTGSR